MTEGFKTLQRLEGMGSREVLYNVLSNETIVRMKTLLPM